jgi:hypothetical protein
MSFLVSVRWLAPFWSATSGASFCRGQNLPILPLLRFAISVKAEQRSSGSLKFGEGTFFENDGRRRFLESDFAPAGE